ncbi:MAG TPA: hypothetical protein VER33_15580 [Polyangiaceae bacterium]|nr:hypothetical protein [Ardenticatenaceae bacterium]HYO95939.1 hypothetical protein [Polyangiaceae bacterium]
MPGRGPLLGVVLLACLLGTLPSCGGSRSDGAYARTPFVDARSAHSFVESVGVNVHLTNLDTSYRDFPTLQARLSELGVRHIRDGICASCSFQIDRLKALAAAGIRSNLIVGYLRGGTRELEASLAAVRDHLVGGVASVEAPNEVDAEGDPQWIEHTRIYQTELYRRVKGEPRLAHLPVIGPSLTEPNSRAALGDLSPFLDRGNLHPYSSGGPPLANLTNERQMAARVSKQKPLVITEVGYHTDMTRGDHLPASDKAITIYTPRIFLEAFRERIERTYLYQLADPLPAAEARARGFPAFENRFGLLRADLSRKASFLALRNLLRAVSGRAKPVSAPGGLRLGLDGEGHDVRRLLLRSGPRSYALVLWRNVSVWNVAARRDYSPPADDLEVVLGQRVERVQRLDPASSANVSESWESPRRIRVALKAAPVVLRLALP